MLKNTSPKTHILAAAFVAAALPLSAMIAPATADTPAERYGAGDTLGAVNLLSAEKAQQAAGLVTKGKVYQLGMVTSGKTPAYGPRKFQMIVHQLGDGSGLTMGTNSLAGNDDTVITSVGIGSQIDGLGHIGREHVYYPDHKAAEVVAPDGLLKFGTHGLPGIVTRGVLIDMSKYFKQNPVANGTAYTKDDIQTAARQQGVSITKGDVVILNSGYLAATKDLTSLPPGLPGLGVSGAEYLAGLGVVAVGHDSWALEVLPSEDPTEAFPVHQVLLTDNGVYILENMVTEELIADGVNEFMFTLGVPKLQGAVQAIINPLAIR